MRNSPGSASKLRFAIPGLIETRTGGTVYDKRVMDELRHTGWAVEHLEWPGSFPFPTETDEAAVAASLAACPDGALVLIDGLAFGAMPDIAEGEAKRLRLVALVHHPLALETGLTVETGQRFAEMERRALNCARAVIVTSDMTAATLVRDYGVPAGKITVAKPGVDGFGLTGSSPSPRPSPIEGEGGRKAFAPSSKALPLDGGGLGEGDAAVNNAIPHLISIATVTPRKGHDVLVGALASIGDLNWHCTIAGSLDRSPETAAALRKRIEKHRLIDRIALIGEVDDPAPLYRAADLFVLPSRYEGYGMAIADALAWGLPVVATRVGAIPEVVPDTAGLLVPADDPVALAAALRRVLTDPGYRQTLARGARQAAASLPRWKETAELTALALDRVE